MMLTVQAHFDFYVISSDLLCWCPIDLPHLLNLLCIVRLVSCLSAWPFLFLCFRSFSLCVFDAAKSKISCTAAAA